MQATNTREIRDALIRMIERREDGNCIHARDLLEALNAIIADIETEDEDVHQFCDCKIC